ncbi:MAG: hypothetical protein Q8M51_11275 [Polaromonas sp.]|nr:hypothetical protein [Polaromonas sp.]
MPMSHMDEHIKAIRGIHERMMAAKTPENRNPLIAEHPKPRQDSMAMMPMMMDRMPPAAAKP